MDLIMITDDCAAWREAVAMVAGECGEVVQDAMKFIQHGHLAVDDQPGGTGKVYDNEAALRGELWDVMACTLLAHYAGAIAHPCPVAVGTSLESDTILFARLERRYDRLHNPELKRVCAELMQILHTNIDSNRPEEEV
jgi:hypothetical protein